MTFYDDDFLRDLNIEPWPDCDNYKTKETDRMNSANFEFLDTYPSEVSSDPFLSDAPSNDMSQLWHEVDPIPEELDSTEFKTEIVDNLRYYVAEYLSFSTLDELNELISDLYDSN